MVSHTRQVCIRPELTPYVEEAFSNPVQNGWVIVRRPTYSVQAFVGFCNYVPKRLTLYSGEFGYRHPFIITDIKNNQPEGNFHMRTVQEEWNGFLDAQGVFTGWRKGNVDGYYLNGYAHGVHKSKTIKDGLKTSVAYTFDSGIADGPFVVKNNETYEYGILSEGKKEEEYVLDANDYPFFKKMGLFPVYADFITQSHRKKLAQKYIRKLTQKNIDSTIILEHKR